MCLGDKRFWLYSVILSVTVGVCYFRSLKCGFIYDDSPAVVKNEDLRPHTPLFNLFWNDFWGTPMTKEMSHKSYRPLCVLTFRFNYWLSELEPMSYHIVNVVLHAMVCLMFMKVCRMFLHEMPSFLAALLFAVHPIHTEAVTGIVGRAELLSSIFFLQSLMTYTRCTGYRRKTIWKPLFITIGLVSMAMLCKEQGITAIGICVVYELFVAQRVEFKELWGILMGMLKGNWNLPNWLKGSILRSLVLVGSTVILLFARIEVMGGEVPDFSHYDNPAAASPTPARQLTFNYLLPVNFWLLLCPAGLCCDWTRGTIPIIMSILDPRNLATLLFYACLGKVTYFALSKQGRLNRAVIMCLALMVLPFIPASNLFFPVGFVVAERILYTPSMGFCMFVAVGFDVLLQYKKSLRSLLWILMSVLVATHVGKTYVRNIDCNAFCAVPSTSQEPPMDYHGWLFSMYTGLTREECEGENSKGAFSSTFILIGAMLHENIYVELDGNSWACERSALTVNKLNSKLWGNLGLLLENQQKLHEALDYYKKGASVQPDDIEAHMNVGHAYNAMKRFDDAEKAYERAKDLFPPFIPGETVFRIKYLATFLHLALLYSRDLHRMDEADKVLKTVIEMKPDYVNAYVIRGDLMLKLGRPQAALSLCETASQYEPNDPDVLFTFGRVYLDLGNRQQAYQHFEKSLAADPDNGETMFQCVHMIIEDRQHVKFPLAQKRLAFLMKNDTTDCRHPHLMAGLSWLKEEFATAEKYFRLAVEICQSHDKHTATYELSLLNLSKFLTQMNRTAEAESFLQTLLKQNPNHVKGLNLLGLIAVNIQEDFDKAEQCYKKVMGLQSDNTEAMQNLCVVYYKQGDLFMAEQCFANLHQLLPEKKDILLLLNSVRKEMDRASTGQLPNQQQGQASQGQAGQGQAGQGQAYQGQAHQGQAGQGQTGQGQSGQDQARQGQAHQGQAQQGHAGQGQAHQGQTHQGQAGQGQAGQGKAYQGQAHQGQAHQGQTGQG